MGAHGEAVRAWQLERYSMSAASQAMTDCRALIELAWERRSEQDSLSSEMRRQIYLGMSALGTGDLRAAEPHGDDWVVNEWVKKLILLYFLSRQNGHSRGAIPGMDSYDKIPLKFDGWSERDFAEAALRVVPGAVVRFGAHVSPRAVLMPSFVNVGAYVGPGTMVDTWATIGSCAQIGASCHISGGVGVGGVLEPIGDSPVIIEDGVFVGARSEIAEGVRIRRHAVISMGVFLGKSTPIVNRMSGEVTFGEVPENAVVIPGGRSDSQQANLSTYAAVIVKFADERTRGKVALNDLVRR